VSRLISVAAVDLDGTLLRTDATVSPRTVAALAAFERAGGRTVIVTARPPRFVKLLAAEAGIGGVAVCSNGAIAYDLGTEEITVTGPMPVRIARSAAAAVAAVVPGAAFAMETGRCAFIGPGYGHRATRDDARVQLADEAAFWAATDLCVKLLAWSPAPVTGALLDLVAQALPPTVELTYSGASGMLEINAAGVSKVHTLATLCEGWGVDAAQVAAFGDMPNDLPVLRWAGLAVAVANADPAVLACAHRVTAGNDDDGVAMVLDELLAHAAVVPGR
jgi:Cof subfamily protein (haloacid dehalogenase superfamily)